MTIEDVEIGDILERPLLYDPEATYGYGGYGYGTEMTTLEVQAIVGDTVVGWPEEPEHPTSWGEPWMLDQAIKVGEVS